MSSDAPGRGLFLQGGRLSTCKHCSAEVTWAWSEQRSRWAPIEPDSVSGDEREIEDDYGRPAPVIEGWHRYHSCLKKKTAKVDPVDAAYATLHLASTAPEAVIKAAHRALSLLHHPDRGGDLEKMKRVNAAYDTIVGR